MDETVIVIMVKNKNTGFLEKELCSFTTENQELIYSAYAEESPKGYKVYLKLCCPRDVEDWEFNAIYDYYDDETILPFVSSIKEDTGHYNPTWVVKLDYPDNEEIFAQKIKDLLIAHKTELLSVFSAIADKKDEYLDYE